MSPSVFMVLIAVVGGPVVGGLMAGLDRKLTARLQGRKGPPVIQPFYDLGKLLAKAPARMNGAQTLFAWLHCVAAATALALFLLQDDLLMIFFVQAAAGAFLVMGGLAAPSPWSQTGAQRELLQMAAYEPLLVLALAGMVMKTGSFRLSAVYALPEPLLPSLPLVFLAMGYALTIKLRKSPFDLAASHHGHQELVKGVYTEYSGPTLALVELGHWYETVLTLCVVSLFWHVSWVGMVLTVVLAYGLEVLVDNVTARLTWRIMLGRAWAVGLALAVVNLVLVGMPVP